MNKLQRVLLLSAMVALSGCDAVRDSYYGSFPLDEPTLVFPSGFEITVHDQNVPIQGFDKCPDQDALMERVFGPASSEGDQSCVVITEDRSIVPVRVFLPSGAINENWKIIRESVEAGGGMAYTRTTLERPDGSLVVPAGR